MNICYSQLMNRMNASNLKKVYKSFLFLKPPNYENCILCMKKKKMWLSVYSSHCSKNSLNCDKINDIDKTATIKISPIRDKSFYSDSHKKGVVLDIKDARKKVKEKMDEIIERENIWTVPNLLCIGRIVMSPLLCYYISTSYYSLALGMFIFAGFTDLMDGWIARTIPGQASRLGSFLDPLADKVLVASAFLTLTFAGLIPIPLTVVIVYRDLAIIAGASYIRYKSLPPPITFSRYFDATHATVQLAPTNMSKLNTAIQLGLITASLAAPVFAFSDHFLLHSLLWVTGGTTIISGISYIFSNESYKMLKYEKERINLENSSKKS